MTALRRCLLCGIIAFVVIFFWRRNPVVGGGTPAPAIAVALPPVSRKTSALSPETKSEPGAVPKAAAPSGRRTDDWRTALHLKLRELLETKTGDTETPERLVQELLALVDGENAPEIARTMSAEELHSRFGGAFLERWLEMDATRAADWIAARSEATEEQAWLVARRLLVDPAGLRDYCDRLNDSAWKENVLNGAGLAVLAKNPAEAVALAQRMVPGAMQNNLLETVAYDWTGRDPRAAMEWILEVKDPAVRERLFAVGAKAIAAADPDLAVGWLGSAVKTEAVLHDTALVVVETWVAQDPAAAARWVAQFPAQSPRAAAVDIVVRRWMQSDADAATAWIQTLPEREKILADLTAKPAASELERE